MLEWEVVTAQGKHVVATPTQNVNLFWALSGGGGGTYGVVVSMTTRLFKDGPVGRAALAFSAASTGGNDSFWKAADAFHSHLQPIADDHGIVVIYVLANESLNVYTVMSPNRTADEITQISTWRAWAVHATAPLYCSQRGHLLRTLHIHPGTCTCRCSF